jgi:hypothetical protein
MTVPMCKTSLAVFQQFKKPITENYPGSQYPHTCGVGVKYSITILNLNKVK